MAVEARLLGPVTVTVGGADVDLGPPRQRAVFATLAAHANQVVSREELVDSVWGLDAPATAINSVYTYIAGLRNRLEPARPQRARSQLLVSDGSGYLLKVLPHRVDTQRFEAYLENARQLYSANALHSAVAEIEAGLMLWHGNPYGGVAGPFVEAERTRLTELRLAAMEGRAKMLVALERHADIVDELFGLVRRHPLRERLRYLLMICYVRLGRQADAIGEYHDLRKTLADELGIEPCELLQRLRRDLVQRSQPRPQKPSPRPSGSVAGSGRHTTPAQLPRDVPGFTGGAAEIRQMHDLMSAARASGESVVILLTGAPGVGKSALAVHFAHTVSRQFPDGQLHLDLRGFAPVPPMEPIEALGHLNSGLGGSTIGPTDLERQATLYRSAVAGRQMLILLDNAISAAQVRPLLPGAASCLVIVTSRNRLAGLVARDGAKRITLNVMRDDDATRLFSTVVGCTFNARDSPAVRRLVAACGRLPLALRIAAARINTSPSPERAIADFAECDLFDRLLVPEDDQSSLRTVFDWSHDAACDEAVEMLRALGRHTGPEVTLKEAAALLGTSHHNVRRRLDALVEASLVQETLTDHFRMNTLVFAYARQLADETRRPDTAVRTG